MRRVIPILFPLLFLCACAATEQAPPQHELLAKAIEARGGRDLLEERDGIVKIMRGTYRGQPFSATQSYRKPNQVEWRIHFDGIDGEVIRVFDGSNAYQIIGSRLINATAKEGRELRQRAMGESAVSLIALDNPNFTCEEIVNAPAFKGQQVRTLRVEHWTGFSQLLHFDAESLDLIGLEGFAWTELTSAKALLVTHYEDFREVEGQRLPFRFTTSLDDDILIEAVMDEIRTTEIPLPEHFLAANRAATLKAQGAGGAGAQN